MFPYTAWLAEVKKNRDLGEAAIGQIDTGSFMLKLFLLGGFRGIVANVLWTPRRGTEARPRLGPAQVHRRLDHQAPAPLSVDLDLPGLEPRLQRLGRMGRAGRQVRVDQAGNPVRAARASRTTAILRTSSTTPPGSTITSSVSPTNRSSSAGSSGTTRTNASRRIATPSRVSTSSSTTTSSLATAGSAGPSSWSTAGATA